MMTYKTENNIWVDMIALLNQALAAKDITDMTVMRANQPFDVTKKSVVLISRINSSRYGWRGRKNKVINSQMTHIENYFQELQFQITVLKQAKINDIEDLTATDIANKLVDYLLSNKGLESLRGLGYMPLRITRVREPTFVNETDNYQVNPNFDLICYIQQEIDDTENVVDGYDFKLTGV